MTTKRKSKSNLGAFTFANLYEAGAQSADRMWKRGKAKSSHRKKKR